MNTCPICCTELKEGERLEARYIPDRGWWLICHQVPYKIGDDSKIDHMIDGGKTYSTDCYSRCAKAGFKFVGETENQA